MRLKLRIGRRACLVWALCAAAFGCSLPMKVDSVGAFAGRAVTCDELRGYAAELVAYPGASAAPPHSPGELLEQYVIAQMLGAEARRSGVDRSATFLHRYREARRSLLHEILEADLDAEGGAERVSVAEDDAAPADFAADEPVAYGATSADEQTAERTRVRLILIRLDADATRAAAHGATAELQAIQAEFLSGVPFADLAARHSQHESAPRGGTLSPRERAALGDAFERVAGRLESGEISDVVRVADGVALILVDEHFVGQAPPLPPQPSPQRQPPAQRVVGSLEQRARTLAERRLHRRAAWLAEARVRWTVQIETSALADHSPELAAAPVAYIDNEPLTLADLGLEHRPPLLREAVTQALEDELLVRLAESRATPAALANLEALRRGMLVEIMQNELVRFHLLDTSEPTLRKRYDIEIERFRRSERRVFEVVRVAAEAGNLQEAYAAAAAIARIWTPDGPLHQRNRAEIWGPITQADLELQTSPQLAQIAFALRVDEVSAPILLEGTGTAEPDTLGYALLRVHAVEAAGVVPFAEALPSLVAEAGDAAAEARTRVRMAILQQVGIETRPPLRDCSMTPGALEDWLRQSAPDTDAAVDSARRTSVWDAPRIERRKRAVGDGED